MRSQTTATFWNLYGELPEQIQRRADSAYRLWQLNPYAHGLFFKRVGRNKPIYSVRIGLDYRALGVLDGDAIIWFWIGPHDVYERMLRHF
ncbi:MAG: hypothetical protein ABTQ73_05240 [Caldilineales bacterium]